jgi:hypothetical protein
MIKNVCWYYVKYPLLVLCEVPVIGITQSTRYWYYVKYPLLVLRKVPVIGIM